MDKEHITTEYATGSVEPPKNYRLLFTGILLCVIFFGCLISALNIANVRLFAAVFGEETHAAVRFEEDVRFTEPPQVDGYTCIDELGIQGRFLSEADQRYFDLPQGIYISDPSALVPELQVGDVLLKIGDHEIGDPQTLSAFVENHRHGITVTLEIYRDGKHQTLTATLCYDPEVE